MYYFIVNENVNHDTTSRFYSHRYIGKQQTTSNFEEALIVDNYEKATDILNSIQERINKQINGTHYNQEDLPRLRIVPIFEIENIEH